MRWTPYSSPRTVGWRRRSAICNRWKAVTSPEFLALMTCRMDSNSCTSLGWSRTLAVSSCGDARVGCSFTEDADRMADVIHFPVPSTSTTTATAGAPVSASDGTGDAPPSEEHLNLLRQWVLPRGQEWFYPVGPPPAEAPAPRRRALRSLTRRPCLGRDTVCLTNVPVLWLHVRQAPVADLGTSPHRRRHQHRLQQTRTLVPTAHPRRRGPMRGGCSAQSLRVL